MTSCLLSSAYLAPIPYYAYLYHAPQVWIEVCDSYLKQTYRNRMEIASPNGKISLTIPIEKPENDRNSMKDIRISSHGNWNRLHWQALLSAYGKSPFFDYYADDYVPIFSQPDKFLIDFNERLMQTTLHLLHIHKNFSRTLEYKHTPPTNFLDLREAFHPKKESEILRKEFRSIPYYQVFSQRNGFIPHLSILDLLFNMGPESLLILRDSLSNE